MGRPPDTTTNLGASPDRPAGGHVLVGLTGAIAAGKSEALAALERLGAATLSADAVVHDLLGLEGDRFQDLYHFTLGGPVEDTRLQSHPPYAHLKR